MHDRPWIIGSGGLLGRALSRRLKRAFLPQPIPWADPSEASARLTDSARTYALSTGADWVVIWAAGAAVVGVDKLSAQVELAVFESAVRAVRDSLPAGRGVFFLTSSAGGVYAGSKSPPFDEATLPCPISAYGRLKLDMEQLATEMLGDHCRVIIGRFANLYGTDQNLQKAQGLISQLCRYSLTRTPLNIYVPLETIRDYIYVDDAAAHALALIRGESGPPHAPAIRNIASFEPATVARLIDLVTRESRHRPLISVGVDRNAAAQVRDLRLRTLYADEHVTPPTSIQVGVAKVWRHTATLIQAGGLREVPR